MRILQNIIEVQHLRKKLLMAKKTLQKAMTAIMKQKYQQQEKYRKWSKIESKILRDLKKQRVQPMET